MIRQIGRFLLVGGLAASVEFGGFLLLFYVLHTSLWFANGVSFVMGLLTSFALNRQWTFFTTTDGEYSKRLHHQFVMYLALALMNLLLTIWFVQVFTKFGVLPAIAKILAMGITSVWNFFLYKTAIFKRATS